MDCKDIFWMNLSILKKTLSLYEYKVGKNSDEYKYFKQQIMDYFFLELDRFYKESLKKGLIKKCPCGTNVRKGFKDCECGGSGYISNK